MSRLTAPLLTLLTILTAALFAAPALADTGFNASATPAKEGQIHVKSARKLILAPGSQTTRVVSEASSASYTLTRDEDGVTATFGPTTRTTHVETVVRSPIRVAGVKNLSEPETEETPAAFIVAAALISSAFAVVGLAIGFTLGRRRPKGES